MITHSGASVWPDNDGVPTLRDIGRGLGRTARFAGQTEHYYTVLAHTFVVTELVKPENRIHALLHDAPEAIVGDVPTTWKTGAARDLEQQLLERIYLMLGLGAPSKDAQADVVRADHLALVAEAHVLGHAQPGWWNEDPDPAAVRLTERALVWCPTHIEAETTGSMYAMLITSALRKAEAA